MDPHFYLNLCSLPFKNLNGKILYIRRRTDGHVKLTHIEEEEEALVLNVSDG